MIERTWQRTWPGAAGYQPHSRVLWLHHAASGSAGAAGRLRDTGAGQRGRAGPAGPSKPAGMMAASLGARRENVPKPCTGLGTTRAPPCGSVALHIALKGCKEECKAIAGHTGGAEWQGLPGWRATCRCCMRRHSCLLESEASSCNVAPLRRNA